jgi:hypothetical protein
MAVTIVGITSGTGIEVETTHKAMRITNRPLDHGALGHYSYGGFTGIIPAALAANSEIFQFRWSHASNLAIIRRVTISASVSTTFFAAGVPVQVDLIKSTGWTVAGTGGTGITPAALLKRRTNMGSSTSTAGDIRIATTAALGAGTKTLETYALASILAPGPAAAPGMIFPANTILFDAEVDSGDHPLVLAQNEGFSIRSVAVPGTGTWTAAVTVDWAEVASTGY